MTSKHVLVLFGLVNLSLLAFFTPLGDASLLAAQDPLFFQWSGIFLIALWGLAYMAAAPFVQALPWLMLVFALEKLLFGGRWLWWISHHGDQVPQLWQQDLLVALFFAAYGVWDTFCALVFFWLAWQGWQSKTHSTTTHSATAKH